MRRAMLALAVVLGLALPSGAWAAGRTAAQQPVATKAKAAAKAKAASRRTRTNRPQTARAAVLHSLRSRGIVRPSRRLFENSGIAGGPSEIFSEQNLSRRVTRKGALPGETELVNVQGRVEPSKKNKSGWSVHAKITPVRAPSQTLEK
jgi:hypothetical protein